MVKIPTDAEDVSKAVGFTYRLMDEAAGHGHLQVGATCRIYVVAADVVTTTNALMSGQNL